MPVADSFQKLLGRIYPLDSELARAKTHANSISGRLSQAFTLKKFVIVGSHSRGSAIRGYSDVDYFALLSRDDARWGRSYVSSTTVLGNVRKELMGRFRGTEISRDGQAVVVHFARGDFGVDVVPAFFDHMGPGYPIYNIPDGSGNWMPTSPDAHNRYINEEDRRATGKLKRVARLVKYWRECRNPRVPLNSFHLELLLAYAGICVGPKSYQQCLIEAFGLLAQRGCAGLRDPLGISGVVSAANTDAQRIQAAGAAEYAYKHASAALEAEISRNTPEARRQWNIVFNGNFPT